MPRVVPRMIEMTSPGSELRYRITYPNGNQKWVKELPGHKSDRLKVEERKRQLRENPAIGEFLKEIRYLVELWIRGKIGNEVLLRKVRDFELEVGYSLSRSVIRRLRRSEGNKYKKCEGEGQCLYYSKIIEAIELMVEYVGRRERR